MCQSYVYNNNNNNYDKYFQIKMEINCVCIQTKPIR